MNEQKPYKCNTSTVVIREGDILNSQCEVIASSDNVALQMSYGVSRTIHEHTGSGIDVDLDKVKNVELGDVVVTKVLIRNCSKKCSVSNMMCNLLSTNAPQNRD